MQNVSEFMYQNDYISSQQMTDVKNELKLFKITIKNLSCITKSGRSSWVQATQNHLFKISLKFILFEKFFVEINKNYIWLHLFTVLFCKRICLENNTKCHFITAVLVYKVKEEI